MGSIEWSGIIGAFITVTPSILTLIVSTVINSKVKKQNDLREEMESCQLQLKESINSLHDEFVSRTNTMELNNLKRFLINEFTELENGAVKNEEQKGIIHESYDTYTKLGGNGYIHSFYERLINEKKL